VTLSELNSVALTYDPGRAAGPQSALRFTAVTDLEQVAEAQTEVSLALPFEERTILGMKMLAPRVRSVELYDGVGKITLEPNGHIRGIDNLPPEDQERIRSAATSGKVRVPKGLEEIGKSREPVSIETTPNPTIRWSPSEGATYEVEVSNVDSGTMLFRVQVPEWTFGPLQGGGRYTYSVFAIKGGQRVLIQQGIFKGLEQEMVTRLAAAEKAYKGNHLLLGLLYAEAGQFDRSKIEFRLLVALNPTSVVAKRLLESVEARL
jgi:hypothetical protein